MKRSRKVRKQSKATLLLFLILGFIIGTTFTTNLLLGSTGETHIYIIYSSEKASWMTKAYTDFMNEWEQTHPDFKIKIHMYPYGSSDSIISILNGEIFPTIWSPASSIWMTFLNTKWAQYTGDIEPIVDIDEAVRIIYSPIVIATWESFNNTYNIKGFSDLYNLNLNPSVNIKMAHTDPYLSNSGYMSVIMALSAGSGVTSENLTIAELTDLNDQNWLRIFESSAILYGKSTGFLSRYMMNEGPSGLNVAFLYENLIRDISSAATGGKIIAVYPEEGTLFSDHPFCILNANWITPAQRQVAEAFLKFLNRTDTITSAMEYAFRPIDASIPLDSSVFNYETNGLSLNINVPELKTPKDGNVLIKIPDLWSLCKATT
ncbi:MAG: substrate-binding domain-containing protein [Promethearchaeota archaeon]